MLISRAAKEIEEAVITHRLDLRDNERAVLDDLGVDRRDIAILAEVASTYERVRRVLNRQAARPYRLRAFADVLGLGDAPEAASIFEPEVTSG